MSRNLSKTSFSSLKNAGSLAKEKTSRSDCRSEFLVYEIGEKSWPGNSFFSVSYVGPVIFIMLNTNHGFYKEIYLKIKGNKQSREMETLEILLVSYARAVYAETNTSPGIIEHIDLFQEIWGNAMTYFLTHSQ